MFNKNKKYLPGGMGLRCKLASGGIFYFLLPVLPDIIHAMSLRVHFRLGKVYLMGLALDW